jgi:hypothetical protein
VNYAKPQSEQTVSLPRFEQGTSRLGLQDKSLVASGNLWWLLIRNWNMPLFCSYFVKRIPSNPTLWRVDRLILCTTGRSLIKFDLIRSYKTKCQIRTAFNADPYNKFNRNAFGSFWDETWETTHKTYLLCVNFTHFLLNTQRPRNL